MSSTGLWDCSTARAGKQDLTGRFWDSCGRKLIEVADCGFGKDVVKQESTTTTHPINLSEAELSELCSYEQHRNLEGCWVGRVLKVSSRLMITWAWRWLTGVDIKPQALNKGATINFMNIPSIAQIFIY